MRKPTPGQVLALTAYITTVPAANWLITHFGLVPVGFGYVAPAAVYTAGLALVLRDAVHEYAGRDGALSAMAAASALTYVVADQRLALASAVSFAVAEGLDWAVYERLRRRGLALAVLVSGAAGLVVDSLLFLQMAFGSWALLPGQILGKTWTTLVAAGVLQVWQRRREVVSE
ncbi:VUT family protein [Streptomyces scabiei]|uniref:VUT family protein n=1 Tax=Streptomyces scabiei TaxID=1930 RepID=UPI0029AAB2D6|nr:VUT family protein [Streptomyces scabiei]MDX3165972.1 VUT family protein [Streptomyces scabiei]